MAVMQDPDGDTNHGWAAGANNRIALYHPATETWRYFDNTQSKNGLILQNMSIGRFTNGGREFDGRLDDVRVYNQTLTQADLNKLVGGGGGYSNWAGSKLGGQGITDDFNGDGVENGIAYFMNDTGPITLPGVMGGAVTWTNGGHIQASAYGTEFVIETSPDLDLWTPVDVGDLDANTDGPGGSLTYPLPTGMGKIFVRLAVTPK
jgi:hypothetical protein